MTNNSDQSDQQGTTSTIERPQNSDDARQASEQDELRRRYLEQQQRLSCPGCGEVPFLG